MKKGKPKGVRKRSVLKTLLSFALILTLALGNIVPINVAKAEGEAVLAKKYETATTQEEWMNLDFNGEWSTFGSYINVMEPTANLTQVTDPADENNKCLKFESKDATKRYNLFFPKGDAAKVTTGKTVVYEYMISAVEGETINGKAKLFANQDNVAYMYCSGGKIQRKQGSDSPVLVTVSAGTWTKIAMEVDYATGTYNIYVNDQLVEEGKDAAYKEGSTFARICLDKSLGHILIDNMKVYEVIEPKLDPATSPDLLNVDFEEEWSEFGPKIGLGESNSNPDRFTLVQDPGDSTNQCLKFSELAAEDKVSWTSLFTSVSSQTAGKKIVYEYLLSAENMDTISNNVKLFAASGGTSYFRLRGDGKLWFNAAGAEGEELGKVSVGKWVKLNMVVDYSSNNGTSPYNYKIYVNDVLVKDYTDTGASLTAKAPIGIRLESTGDGHILIDDVRIYEGDKPLGAYVPPAGSDQYSPDYINLDFSEPWTEIGGVFGMSAETAKVFTIADPANADNKCLKLVLADDGSAHTDIKYTVPGGENKQIVYEYKVSAVPDEKIAEKVKLFMAIDASGYFYLRSNGAIKRNNEATTFATVTPGTWVKIAMVVDYSTSPYTFKQYVNDVCVVENGTCDGESFMKLRLDKEIPGGHLLIDDLRVYEGSEPHIPGTGYPVGTEIYVNRTFDEIWKYDFEELEVTRNSGSVAVVAGTANKYLKVAGTVESPANVVYLTGKDSNFIVAQANMSLENLTGNEGSIFTGVASDGKTFSFLNLKDDSVQLPDGTEVVKLTTDTRKNIAIATTANKQVYTVYVDGVAVAADVAIVELTDLASFETMITAGSLLIDDLRVYDEKNPKMNWNSDDTPNTIYVPDSEAQTLIGEAVAIQLNANVLYVNGVKTKASKAFDTSENGKVYLALADIKALFGDSVSLSGLTAKDGAYDIYAVATANGYTNLHEMEGRMILFSKAAITLESDTVKEKEVNKYLQFDRPSVDKIKELFNQNVDVNDGHPRLLITQDDVSRIQNLYKNGEEYIVRWGNNAIAAAEAALTTPDFDFNYKPGDSMDHVDQALPMIINLGIATFLTDDAEAKAAYVAKAKSIAFIICNLEDWNPLSYLDVGELSFILGLAYDWFYDEFTEDERAFIEKNLMEKGVGIQNKIYYGKVNSDEVYWTWWDNTNNWNTVCNGGAMLGAIALFDVYPDICAQVISNTLHGVEFMMESYYPEGVWHEGGGYWRYALNYLAYTMTTFDKVFGDDFGFLCSPGLESTGWYGLKLSGSTGINNFGDANTNFIDNKSVLWCADTYNDAELLAARLQEMERQGYIGDGRDIIFYNENLLGDTTVELPLDTVLSSMSVVSLREAWYDKGATFLGFSGSKTKSGHANMDTGTFVVDMYGQRIVVDLGADEYSKDGYFSTKRYWYYRTRPEGHNVYLINPTDTPDDTGVSYPWAKATNTPIVAKDKGAFSTLDLTAVYADDVNSAIRGFMLTDDRRSVLVRDEIDLKAASDLYSYVHVKATAEIDPENPNVAILTQNGTKYKVIIDVQGDEIENYSFKVLDAVARGNYGVIDAKNVGICKLEIYVKTKAAGKINITMKIVGYDDPAADVALITTPIAQWSADMIPDGETPDLPYVDMIYLDGEPIDNFDPVVTGYSKRLGAAAKLPVLTASSEKYDRIEITHPNEFGEEYVVKVYDNEDENLYRVYRLSYTRLPALEPVDGRERYSVKNITASATPEESIGNTRENAIDNDFSVSRWTADCKNEGDSHWLMLELDEVSMVHKIGFAFFKGNGRATIFKVEVSEDGETWTEVVPKGQSSGKSAGLEYFYDSEEGIKAKYVRYTGWGNTKNEWNNIAEFVVLGPKDSAEEIYELETNTALDILHNATAADLAGVKIDGVAVNADDITTVDAAASGEIGKVTLSAELMESLTAGDHKLTLEYVDGTTAEVIIVIAEPVAVEIINEGTVTEYENGSDSPVTIHTTGLVAKFIGVKVNGLLVAHENYEVTEGSTIVTFKNEYIDTLAVGEYKVEVLYSGNRSVETTLTITAGADDETTGGADDATTGGADDETTGGADDATTGGASDETTGADESTEADASTEAGTDATPGGDPDTGDFTAAGRWLWLVMVAAVVMTGYALTFERKRQK